MNYSLRFTFCAVLSFLLLACAHNRHRPLSSQQAAAHHAQASWRSIHPQHFTRVDASGPIRLKIIGAHGQSDTLICANHQPPIYYVKSGTLFIRSRHQDSKHNSHRKAPFETVKLLSSDLRAVHLTHDADVTLESIQTHHGITIIDESHGHLIVNGRITLKKLVKYSRGLVRINWINSTCLTLDIRGGDVRLAGIARQVYANVSGDACVDLRSLRARRAFVYAKDHAHINVLALDSLNAFASDDASIDYFKRPKQLAIHTQDRAQVLQIAVWR